MSTPRASFDTVTVDRVTRVFGVTRALAGVSATFRAGEVASLEGGNGAGKSTLLSILATLSRPTAGEVSWGEYRMPEDREAIRSAVGFVAHEAMVYPDLTPRESLSLMATLHGLDEPRARIDAVLSGVGLTALADRPARTFSRGQLQRLAVARAELHDPTLVLFDEPTTGLDARAVGRLEEDIARARSGHRIVVLVTHDAPFAERVADVRITLDRGRIAGTVRVER